MRAFSLYTLAAVTLSGTTAASAQDYPAKPVRIITSGAGGGNDFVSRLLAQALTANTGQQFIVDNRGSGFAPGLAVHQSPADGYTLLVVSNNLWTAPLLQKAPYDPVKDFAPVTLPTRAPYILVVHPALPVKSVKDLVAL